MPVTDGMGRALVLNIKAGGGRRLPALIAFLDTHQPETLVLTEWRDNPAGQEIAAWARARGLHGAGLADGGTANGVFVASRQSFTHRSLTPAVDGSGVLMLCRFAGFQMLAAYFPNLLRKQPFFARCAQTALRLRRRPFVLVGDLNTGNQDRDREPLGVRYHCADAFDALSDACGLVDLWRRSQGDEAREWTWLSHRRNGFRIDHAFANAAYLAGTNPRCAYDHTPRLAGWTDHSAILLHDADVPADQISSVPDFAAA